MAKGRKATDERQMKEHVVAQEGDLFTCLLSLGLKRTRVKQLLKHRALCVNGKPLGRHDCLLKPGDRISFSSAKKASPGLAPKLGIRVVFEDEAVMVIDKPSGLLTIGTEKERTRTAYFQMNQFLRDRHPDKKERIFIVHRLDRETSGLMVFAKTETAKRRLQENWDAVDKRYVALIEGVPREMEGAMRSYLSETSALRVYEDKASEKARYAVTKYKVLKSGRGHSLVEVAIETGRKHQIRVHFSGIGHPVAGDKKYGAETDPLKRLALHASRLSFSHPLTGKRLEFQSRASQSFDACVCRLKT
jgi:23S rRNA pseudouridine1911/1915/1917 synthase